MTQAPWLPTKAELDDPDISEDKVWAKVWTRMKRWYLKGCLEKVSPAKGRDKESVQAGRKKEVQIFFKKLEKAITRHPQKVFCVTFLMAFVPVEQEEEDPAVKAHEKSHLAIQESNEKLLKKLKSIQGVKDVHIFPAEIEWEEKYKRPPSPVVEFDRGELGGTKGDLVRFRGAGSKKGKGRPSSASHSKKILMMVELLIKGGVKSKTEAFRLVASALYFWGFTNRLNASSIESTFYKEKKKRDEPPIKIPQVRPLAKW